MKIGRIEIKISLAPKRVKVDWAQFWTDWLNIKNEKEVIVAQSKIIANHEMQLRDMDTVQTNLQDLISGNIKSIENIQKAMMNITLALDKITKKK